ncbi:MAG: alpha/beta hydrolase, partial [Nodosilinea sp.]
AGTSGPRGSLSPFGDEVNDGIVALCETTIIGPEEVLQIPAWHTFMMNHPQVQKIVKECLKR